MQQNPKIRMFSLILKILISDNYWLAQLCCSRFNWIESELVSFENSHNINWQKQLYNCTRYKFYICPRRWFFIHKCSCCSWRWLGNFYTWGHQFAVVHSFAAHVNTFNFGLYPSHSFVCPPLLDVRQGNEPTPPPQKQHTHTHMQIRHSLDLYVRGTTACSERGWPFRSNTTSDWPVSGEDVHQAGFARPGWSHNGGQLCALELPGNAFQNRLVTCREHQRNETLKRRPLSPDFNRNACCTPWICAPPTLLFFNKNLSRKIH